MIDHKSVVCEWPRNNLLMHINFWNISIDHHMIRSVRKKNFHFWKFNQRYTHTKALCAKSRFLHLFNSSHLIRRVDLKINFLILSSERRDRGGKIQSKKWVRERERKSLTIRTLGAGSIQLNVNVKQINWIVGLKLF